VINLSIYSSWRVKTIFFLRDCRKACRSLPTRWTWAVSVAVTISKTSHGELCLVSELAWCVYSFLPLQVLAWELFNFTFDGVLHKVLWLAALIHALRTIVLACAVVSIVVLKVAMIYISTSWFQRLLARKRRRRVYSDATTLVTIGLVWVHALKFRIVWVLLDSACTSRVGQVIMHYLPPFSLGLNAASWRCLMASINHVVSLETHARL